jgi:hypothetical protein
MALAPVVTSPSTTSTTVDTRASVFGYDGFISAVHARMPFEHLPNGASSVTGVALSAMCSVDLPFHVVARDVLGTETVVQTGTLLASTLQSDSGSLTLSPPDFVSMTSLAYAVRLDFPEAPSGSIPNGYVLLGAPADGEGFTAVVTTALA